jgi:predicted nuclease of predicted toxin-antitoxin system
VKFLVDAQLPRQLALELSQAGHEAIHTLDLPQGNRTSDEEIISKAAQDSWIVITKDSDFVTSFLLRRLPPKLLLISTGNISNERLLELLRANLSQLESILSQNDFVELSSTAITIHS